ncbi:unnamed protein product [Tuber melanosporum]|uniref:(Perigord truffle) hypothetical protein n=1 Tax=Tuber melanosporum (strain Mel28) TaxID=656061 RepID=D5GA78_TUBMM|nr:uncharacterized protein GSTUM_00005173001 [Tuber melanosporum]CAZ81432.1 unnamed protein product [Tuber melanosporum]
MLASEIPPPSISSTLTQMRYHTWSPLTQFLPVVFSTTGASDRNPIYFPVGFFHARTPTTPEPANSESCIWCWADFEGRISCAPV